MFRIRTHHVHSWRKLVQHDTNEKNTYLAEHIVDNGERDAVNNPKITNVTNNMYQTFNLFFTETILVYGVYISKHILDFDKSNQDV